MKNVLILEEDSGLRKQICEIVYSHNKSVHIFQTHRISEAYQIVLSHNIEMIIADVILDRGKPEDISGLKFVADIRELDKYAFVPVILLSALTDEKLYAYSKLHCYGFLEKPFSLNVLSGLIKEAMRYQMVTKQRTFIHFRQGGVVYPIQIKDIVYVEHKRRKMYVHTKSEEIEIPYHTCEQTLSELKEHGFLLCARGIVVNLDYIYALDMSNHFVVLKDNLGCLELGRKYFKGIKEAFVK